VGVGEGAFGGAGGGGGGTGLFFLGDLGGESVDGIRGGDDGGVALACAASNRLLGLVDIAAAEGGEGLALRVAAADCGGGNGGVPARPLTGLLLWVTDFAPATEGAFENGREGGFPLTPFFFGGDHRLPV